jgi:hypothetical protein
MRRDVGVLLVLAGMLALVAAATGRLQPNIVADTPSYVDYPWHSFDAALRSIRTPGYPAMLRLSGAWGGNQAMPWMHVLLHAVASWALWRELVRWSVGFWPSFAAAIAVGLGCTFMDHVATVATDAPAASLGVLAAVAMMRWHRKGQRWSGAVWVAGLSVLAIALRPAYLALAPWTFLCGAMLRFSPAQTGKPVAAWSWIAMPGLITAAVIAWMTLRLVVVSDFGVLPFGHQNLAGITVQLVSDDELRSIEGPSNELASQIIVQRQRRIDDGFRFVDGDPGATMTLEGRWNDMIYQVVVPAAKALHGDDTIANHNAIQELNAEIVRRYPLRYVRWLLLATRRAAWAIAADIVMHPIFLSVIALAVAWESQRLWRGVHGHASAVAEQTSTTEMGTTEIGTTEMGTTEMGTTEMGTAMLFLVGGSYAVVQVAFVILTSPPLGRFADAAAIFIPAWIACKLVQRYRANGT